jgi:SsrA-binding protein
MITLKKPVMDYKHTGSSNGKSVLKLGVMTGKKIIARNRKAKFEYELLEIFEAGIELKGSEIKSIRAGQVSLSEAYVRTNGKQAWLVGAHIAPYEQANVFNHDPERDRRLLLHKREIKSLWEAVRLKGVTIVPTMVYLRNGLAKVEIALAKGKRIYDKRQAIKKRDMDRDVERALGNRRDRKHD